MYGNICVGHLICRFRICFCFQSELLSLDNMYHSGHWHSSPVIDTADLSIYTYICIFNRFFLLVWSEFDLFFIYFELPAVQWRSLYAMMASRTVIPPGGTFCPFVEKKWVFFKSCVNHYITTNHFLILWWNCEIEIVVNIVIYIYSMDISLFYEVSYISK